MALPAWVQITPSQWAAMSPEQQEQILMQAADDVHRQSIQEAEQFKENNKPPSQDEEIMAAIAGPGSLLGGYYLSNVLPSVFSGGGAAAAGTATAAGAGTAAAGTAAATGATAAAAPAAAAPAAAAGGLGASASSLLGAALPAAGIGLGGYGLYDLATNRESSDLKATTQGFASGAAAGAGLGAMFGGVGAIPGAIVGGGIGALGGLLSSNFGSGKSKEQRARDKIRAGLREAGAITVDDGKWNLTRADGSKYDIGTEDVARPDDYQIEDFNKEGIAQTIGWTDPLAAIITGGDKTLKEQFAGYFTNMAAGGGDARANVQNLYKQVGFDSKDKAWEAINALEAQGKIDQQTGHIYRNSLNLLFDAKGQPKDQKAGMVQPSGQSMAGPVQQGGTTQSGVGKSAVGGQIMGGQAPAPQRLTAPAPNKQAPNRDSALLQALAKPAQAQPQQQGAPTPNASPAIASKPKPDNVALAEALKPRKSPQDPNGSRSGVRFNITGSPIVKQRALEYWLSRNAG